MKGQYFELEKTTFRLIMLPLSGINLCANSFFIYCLISNRHRLRQPLKMLLSVLAWCSIAFVVHLVITHQRLSDVVDSRNHLVWMIGAFIIHSSMTCSVWLSFYYYIQVVPNLSAVLMWAKRNIKSFTYGIFLFNEIVIACGASLNFSAMYLQTCTPGASNCTNHGVQEDVLMATSNLVLIFIKAHILWGMALTGVCNYSMGLYLLRHIKSLTREGFAASVVHGQLRVAVTGFLQGAFFLISGLFYFLDTLSFEYSEQFKFGPLMSLTFSILYVTGTTTSLALGQAIFRQGVADAWEALTAPCKRLNLGG